MVVFKAVSAESHITFCASVDASGPAPLTNVPFFCRDGKVANIIISDLITCFVKGEGKWSLSPFGIHRDSTRASPHMTWWNPAGGSFPCASSPGPGCHHLSCTCARLALSGCSRTSCTYTNTTFCFACGLHSMKLGVNEIYSTHVVVVHPQHVKLVNFDLLCIRVPGKNNELFI